ncbi:unnamed protein product [Malus baccata var. baccata]
MSISKIACTYAVLILHDDGIPITPGLFTKLAKKRNIEDLILNVGAGGGGAAAAPGAGGAAPAAATPAAHLEEEEEERERERERKYQRIWQ